MTILAARGIRKSYAGREVVAGFALALALFRRRLAS